MLRKFMCELGGFIAPRAQDQEASEAKRAYGHGGGGYQVKQACAIEVIYSGFKTSGVRWNLTTNVKT